MIYISGQMTGIKDYNYPKFNSVAETLRSKGIEVFNPAEIKIDPRIKNPKKIWKAYMRKCIPAIKKCDMILMLKGWELSKGAKQELKRAIELGLEVVLEQ